jgi:hypothetical protein
VARLPDLVRSSDRRSMERAAMDGRDFPGVTGLFPLLLHGLIRLGETFSAFLADIFPKVGVPRRLIGRCVFVAAFTFNKCWCIHGWLVIQKEDEQDADPNGDGVRVHF